MASTDQMSTVDTTRRQMHKKQGAALLGVLGPFAAELSLRRLRKAITVSAPLAKRRAQAFRELNRQLKRLKMLTTWQMMNEDAHLASRAFGTAAAAHVVTDGGFSVTPEGVDDSDSASQAVARKMTKDQLEGLADDIAGLGSMTDDELLGVIESSPSALYYLDLRSAVDFLAATNDIYRALKVTQVDWSTMNDERVCGECDDLQARSPYKMNMIPDVPHGFCRCWTMPV